MDSLLKTAVAGTVRAGGMSPATTPAEALVPADEALGAERRVLLAAGARATYRRAGLTPGAIPAPGIAPDDATPVCPPGAGRLLARMIGGEQFSLLPEALGRLHRAGLRLPPPLLPTLLHDATHKIALRREALAVIGKRGRWLAAQHPEWRWATARPLDDEAQIPPDAEALWEDGPPSQRVAILELVRQHDPARGREWLLAVWKGEKADFRVEAIATLQTGLSLDDEPFLETAQGDRAQSVRAEATTLLTRLPESALSRRLRDQADRMLSFTPGRMAGGFLAAAKALVQGSSGGKLTADPPTAYDESWARDGIEEKPPRGTGRQAWWLQQFMALVPPAHWSARFAADPATLIAAAAHTVWVDSLLQGWSQAASLHQDAAWAAALWQHYLGGKFNQKGNAEAGKLAVQLAHVLPRPIGEQVVSDVLTREGGLDPRLVLTVRVLPRPWSVPFARAFLPKLQAHLRDALRGTPSYQDNWFHTLDGIAEALPPECLTEALALQSVLPQGEPAENNTWAHRNIANFANVVGFRRELAREIPL